MIDNFMITLTALLVYVVFWTANTVASLVLNIAVIGDEWDKSKFIKSLWRLLGMIIVVSLLTVGLSIAPAESITIDTLANIIMVAAFTRLAEAITKVKDMFGYKITENVVPENIEEKIEDLITGNNDDEYIKG